MQFRIPQYTMATLGGAIADASAPFLVHFGTDWCGPCKRLEKVLGELQPQWGDKVMVGKVNVEDDPDLARAYAVTRNPTLCVFRSGELVARREGYADGAELLALVDG